MSISRAKGLTITLKFFVSANLENFSSFSTL